MERTQAIVVGASGVEQEVTTSDAPAVGDWAVIDDDGHGTLLDRTTALTRLDPDGVNVQVLAANIDIVFVAAPADRPNVTRIERELTIAWASGARPVVIVTKSDIAPPAHVAEIAARLRGVTVLATSVRSGTGIDEIRALLAPNRSAVMLGPSGAGKSSLVNLLVGDDRLAVGAVRDGDHKGRHTTTSRQLLIVPTGGVIIDTPGLRGLGLTEDSLDDVFPEIATLLGTCRFRDCVHDGEPGCAITAAIAAGTIERARFESYEKLAAEIAEIGRTPPAPPPARPAPAAQRRPRRRSIDDPEDDDDDDAFDD